MFCRPLTPAAWICRTIGSTFAAKASGGRTVGLVRLGLRLGQVGAVAEQRALHLPLGQASLAGLDLDMLTMPLGVLEV